MRRDPNGKTTIAEANVLATGHTTLDEDSNWRATIMPHLTVLNLDEEYPRITVPDDMLLDHDNDETDGTYQQGMAIAAEIAKEMLTKGRIRYTQKP